MLGKREIGSASLFKLEDIDAFSDITILDVKIHHEKTGSTSSNIGNDQDGRQSRNSNPNRADIDYFEVTFVSQKGDNKVRKWYEKCKSVNQDLEVEPQDASLISFSVGEKETNTYRIKNCFPQNFTDHGNDATSTDFKKYTIELKGTNIKCDD